MQNDPSTVLVDSSIFIRLMRQGLDPALELTSRARQMDLATCGMVQLEVFRGIRNPRIAQRLLRFMSVMLYASTEFRTWDAVVRLASELDRVGVVLPAQDLIIATCARQLDAAILTLDNHFHDIPNLRVLRSLEELH